MSPPLDTFPKYSGHARKLVMALDVGTTFSGVSYAILDPGEIPKIISVKNYPGQALAQESKIPTVLLYNEDGLVQAAGAAVDHVMTKLRSEGKDPIIVEWFKLHLRPGSLKQDPEYQPIVSFPSSKSAIDIFTDFLRYLFQCAREFIIKTHGPSLWNSVKDCTEIVLSHPNGWEGLQQSKLRDAAISAGLVADKTEGQERVHFVSEGEASLHFCINHGLPATVMQDKKSVMVIDAGGGTVDINTYQVVALAPVTVEEIVPASCIMQGSTSVNRQARKFLEAKLKNANSEYAEDIPKMLKHFEASAKPTFADDSERSYIRFGGRKDTDLSVGIRSGQLTLEGSEMASFFKPSIDAIVDTVIEQHSASSVPASLVLLVGGYAASPWLLAKLKDRLVDIGLEIFCPDSHTNKAVADGAVSFYLKKIVTSRVAKLTYGVPCNRQFCPIFLDHIIRSARIVPTPCGDFVITGAFVAILTKGTMTHEAQELSITVGYESDTPDIHVKAHILCYRGTRDNPRWLDEEPECFSRLCTVDADMSFVRDQTRSDTEGAFHEYLFKIILLCGLTEMKAQIAWEENGVEKRGPAKVVYDEHPTSISRSHG